MPRAETLRVEDGAVRTESVEVAPGMGAGAASAFPVVEGRRNLPRAVTLGATVTRSLPPLPLSLVLGAYVLAAFVVPTFAPVSISDDWTYTRSVEILHRTGELEVLPVAAAAVVFQTVWAWLFTLVFGLSFGAIRLATVVLTFLSGLACYGLCRELGVDRRRSAFGTAALLFNPLAFVLGYSFMSDPYFAALLTISLFFFARGLQPRRPRSWATVAGSAVAAGAFLVRVHGLGIPLGVTLWLLITRRVTWDRAGAMLLLRVWAVPAATAAWYWLIFARGLPSQQGLFLEEAKAAWFGEAWLLVQRLTYLELVYGAFFALPLLLAALFAGRELVQFRRPWAWAGVAVWGAVLLLGLRHFADPNVQLLDSSRRLMPHIPHFFNRQGIGARDLRGYHLPVADVWVWEVLTGLCVGGSLVMAIALLRRASWGSPRQGGVAGMVLICGLIQAAGAVPPSLLFRNWVISLDRYLLPLLPFAIALTLWALKDVRLTMPIAWAGVVLMAIYSVVGTRDSLVFQRNVWNMAEYAVELGVPIVRLDAGYAWDAYHLWQFSYENGIPAQTPPEYYTWWTNVYAPVTDSAYVVAAGPSPVPGGAIVDGYTEIAYVKYSSWLHDEPTYLYLLRRWDAPLPPGHPDAEAAAP